MVSDAPCEQSMAWISVMREAGGYRMWYNSVQGDRRGMRVSYAESDDGLTWRRPALDLLEVEGRSDHNILFEGGRDGNSPEMGGVFRDPAAEPGEEYKMVYAEWIDRRLFDAGQPSNGAMRGACSGDGIRWQRYRENFTNYYPDSQNAAAWDPALGKYVCYHRRLANFAGLDAGTLQVEPQRRGRSVVRLESGDFRTWSNPEPAIMPDLEDGLNTDVYNSAYSRHPDTDHAHYMFPSFYRHYEGAFEVQALTSRDNRTWARPCRDTFIPLGTPGEFDCYIISVAPGIVPVDGDTWALYYRSGDGPPRRLPARRARLRAGKQGGSGHLRQGPGRRYRGERRRGAFLAPPPCLRGERTGRSTPSRPGRTPRSACSWSPPKPTIRSGGTASKAASRSGRTGSISGCAGTGTPLSGAPYPGNRCASTSASARCGSTPSSSSTEGRHPPGAGLGLTHRAGRFLPAVDRIAAHGIPFPRPHMRTPWANRHFGPCC